MPGIAAYGYVTATWVSDDGKRFSVDVRVSVEHEGIMEGVLVSIYDRSDGEHVLDVDVGRGDLSEIDSNEGATK